MSPRGHGEETSGATVLLVDPATLPTRTFSSRPPQELLFCSQKGEPLPTCAGEVPSFQHGPGA